MAILNAVAARGNRRLGYVALTLCLGALTPSMASANDANSTPPHLRLTAGGREPGLIGPKNKGLGYNHELAYFSTSAEFPDSDPDSEYTAGSTVTFVCLLDGQEVPCQAEYSPVEVIEAWPASIRCPRRTAKKRRRRPRLCRPRPRPVSPTPVEEVKGPFTGSVPYPSGLTPGRHTITVMATDEDGTDPSPPSVDVFIDLAPPSKPKLTKAPPRVSALAKPRFKFTSRDNKGFPERTYTSTELFDARLRRLQPPGPSLGMGDPFGNYLEWRGPFCWKMLRCTQVVWPAYSANGEGGTTFGVAEHLNPGLYEFTVKATDTVGNESARTTYRFRVLGAAG